MSNAIKSPEFIEGVKKLRQPWFHIGGREYTRILTERFEGYKQIVKDLNLQEN